MSKNKQNICASMRLDKWLCCARFYKTRSLATTAIKEGKIKIDGTTYSQFYTSRKAIMDTLCNVKLREDLKINPLGPVKCVLTKAKGGGKDYWILKDV